MSKLKELLISLLDLFRFKKSFSQDGEDMVIQSFFENRKNYKGFYVDIGAHHPVRFSNTCFFYRKGWQGINIDPTPGSMRLFKWLRRRDTNLEIGIHNQEGELTFFCFNEPALNTFDEEVAKERNTGNPYRIIRKISVPVMPLERILDQYIPRGKTIDFLTIDVEGLDLEVLKSNNWEKYKPHYVLVEDTGFSVFNPESSPVFQFLRQRGYIVCASLKRTIVYQLTHT